jgi:hypothetical protein
MAVTSTCQSCGASIYKEHVDAGIARYEGGRMLCPHCVADYEREHDAAVSEDKTRLKPISLEERITTKEKEKEASSDSRIQAFGTQSLGTSGRWDESRFKRTADPNSPCATRCRTFHSKLNEGAVDFMSDSINEWIDGNPNISIKFATSTIGIFEGKHADPHLIVTLYY